MIRALAVAFAALACAAPARAGGRAALPSPIAPLSAAPPLAGGATASAEGVAHTIAASTRVDVAIDDVGSPFAVTATQRLDVQVPGDYFFTIGAPVLTVRATASSDSVPGMRTGSILWAGFNPDRRLLVARVTLEPQKVVSALPLRVHVNGGTVVLENTTSVSVGTFTADAPRAPLAAYLARLRADLEDLRTPQQATVPVTSEPSAERVTVAAPLRVTGTVGTRHVDFVLLGKTRIHETGRIDLRVEPIERVEDVDAAGGRALLRAAVRATLGLARARQFEEFLGNPDTAGDNRTVYAYRTTKPPQAAPIADVGDHRRSWITTALVVGTIAAALLGSAALWARS
jgi:hypothetical protein